MIEKQATLIIPAFNEEKTIGEVIDAIRYHFEKFHANLRSMRPGIHRGKRISSQDSREKCDFFSQ